jgi:hypothetical protein
MSRGAHRALAATLCLALIAVIAAGCGNNTSDKSVTEGEPLELGNLSINVQLTRFLNPTDPEDRQYLVGAQVPPPPGKDYLGVFMQIHNGGDRAVALPTAADMRVVDTTGVAYPPLPSHSGFALALGTMLAGHATAPSPDSPAGSGPIQGSVVLFLVDQGVSENRPLELHILADGEKGTVELDI